MYIYTCVNMYTYYIHIHVYIYAHTYMPYPELYVVCLTASNSGRTAEPRAAAELSPGALKKASGFRV